MNPFIELPPAGLVQGRYEWILERCRGKRVLHLGCVDSGLLQDRFNRGELLHQKLAAVTQELWGVDIDAAGIDFLREKGFSNLYTGDVCRLQDIYALQGVTYDVILASEVLEHLLNPGLFLESVRFLIGSSQADLVLTVPNAFRIPTLIWLFKGVEFVHPDHNYWFSYLTASNILTKCGFKIEEVLAYTFQPLRVFPDRPTRQRMISAKDGSNQTGESPPRRSILINGASFLRRLPGRLLAVYLLKKSPFWGDGLIFVAKVKERVFQ